MRALITLAAAFVLLIASCDEEEEQAPSVQDGGVFVELLRLMPDRPEIRAYVEMGDVKRAREALGVGVPPEAVDGKFNGDGFIQYFQALAPPGSTDRTPRPAVDVRFFLGDSSGNAYMSMFAEM